MDEQMIECLYEWHDEAVELGYGEMRVPTEWITAARAAHSVIAERMAELENLLRQARHHILFVADVDPKASDLANAIDAALVSHPKDYCGIVEVNEEDFRAPHPKGTDQL